MAATTVTAVRLRLAGMLGYSDSVNGTADVTKLEPFWTPITSRATAKAEAWLRHTLMNEMGFPATEVWNWPMFVHYHEDLALFYCGTDRNAQLAADVKSALDRLDCRAEVKAVTTLGGSEDVGVGVADLERDDDLFRRPSVHATGSLPGDIFDYHRRLPPEHWR